MYSLAVDLVTSSEIGGGKVYMAVGRIHKWPGRMGILVCMESLGNELDA